MAQAGGPAILLLAGRLCAGKSTLADLLARRTDVEVVSVRSALIARGAISTRESLQVIGAELESSTRGQWLVDAVRPYLDAQRIALVIVDAIRTRAQARAFKASFPSCVILFLRTSEGECRRRFEARPSTAVTDAPTYTIAAGHPTEREALGVLQAADHVLDTDGLPPEVVAQRVGEWLRASISVETRSRQDLGGRE